MLLGIEIGGTKLQLALGTADGEICKRFRTMVDKSRGGLGIREEIQAALPKLLAGSKATSVGVGFGGPIDRHTGRVSCSHQIDGWTDFDLGEWISDLTDAPVRIDNDANVACLGEATIGAGQRINPVFYTTLGSGVGGGLVVDGRIYHGAIPGETEIGHVRLDRDGTIVEDRCSGWAVDRRIREAIQFAPDSALAKLCAGSRGGEARHLATALSGGDPLAAKILDEAAEDLAFGLSHVVHLSHPGAIILGGGLSLIGEPLRAAVEKALRRFTMKAFHPGPMVKTAALGEDSVPCGALLLAGQLK